MAINKRDLGRRIIAGAVYVAITSVCVTASWWTTLAVTAVTAGICCHEFLSMARDDGHRPYVLIGTVTAALTPLGCAVASLASHHAVTGCLVVVFFGTVVMLLRFFPRESDGIEDVALTLFGVIYTGLMLSALILVRDFLGGINGGILAFMLLVSIWIDDGAAYLGGSAFGRHKFAPRISPKKTWEGVVCGLVATVIVWVLVPLVLPSVGFGCGWAALTGLVVGVAGIIGDLTESHIKRSFHAKDSGTLMPGHGGLLDRSDSLIFASIVAWAMLALSEWLPAVLGVVL